MKSDAYLKLGRFTFYGIYAEIVAALIMMNFMGLAFFSAI